MCRVTCGVPQGSIIGPKLFILYINDICKVSNVLSCVLFADDTTLYCSGDNLNKLLSDVMRELARVKKWFDQNILSLNITKTKYIIFGTGQIKEAELKIEDVVLERVYDYKFLGVILDQKLSWKPHIAHVQSKMSKTIAIMYKIKHFLSKPTLFILYCSLLLPYMTYCIEIWGHTYKTYTQPVFILQKRAIRIVNHSHYYEHTNPIFIKYKALKFDDLVNLNTAVFMYKVKRNSVPENVKSMFETKKHNYDLRGKDMFKKQKFQLNIKRHSISIAGVNLWNKLPNELKRSNSNHYFKKQYKNVLLQKYLCAV